MRALWDPSVRQVLGRKSEYSKEWGRAPWAWVKTRTPSWIEVSLDSAVKTHHHSLEEAKNFARYMVEVGVTKEASIYGVAIAQRGNARRPVIVESFGRWRAQ